MTRTPGSLLDPRSGADGSGNAEAGIDMANYAWVSYGGGTERLALAAVLLIAAGGVPAVGTRNWRCLSGRRDRDGQPRTLCLRLG